MMRTWICLLVVLVSTACGGKNATGPSSVPPVTLSPQPTPTVTLTGHLTATNGGQGLAGVQAALGATTSMTDGSGSFSSSQPPTGPILLALTGAGIVPRSLRVAMQATRDLAVDAIALDGQFDLNFYRQFVRNATESTVLEPLRRWTTSPNLYLQTGLADARTLDMVENVVRDSVPRWTNGNLMVAAVERGSGTRQGQAGWLTIQFSPDTQYCGLSDIGLSGGVITLYPQSPNCGCAGYQLRPTAVRHELGHAMGYFHTDNAADVMYRVATQCDTAITPRELYHAAIAYSRPAGNQDPDTDSPGNISLAPMRVIQ